MKIFIGTLIILFILASTTLGVLAIWDIYPISWALIWKTGLSVVGASLGVTLLAMAYSTFFKKENYENRGNKAHPMK